MQKRQTGSRVSLEFSTSFYRAPCFGIQIMFLFFYGYDDICHGAKNLLSLVIENVIRFDILFRMFLFFLSHLRRRRRGGDKKKEKDSGRVGIGLGCFCNEHN